MNVFSQLFNSTWRTHPPSFSNRWTFTLECSSRDLVMTNCHLPLGFSSPSLSGPVSSDAMPNGDGLAEGFGAAGSPHLNGSLPPTAPPQSTSSPVNSHAQESSPGVASYQAMMLEKSEGTSAELTVHTGDSLQSLRLSMPMQETELCKHNFAWSEFPLYILTSFFFFAHVCMTCLFCKSFVYFLCIN